MKRWMLISLVFVCFCFAGFLLFSKRFQVAAEMWHWRHGNSLVVREYKIPVPEEWLVLAQNESGVTMTKPAGNGDMNIITISRTAGGISRLDSWKDMQVENLHRKGITDIREKTLIPDGETLSCVGSNSASPSSSGFVDIQCLSDGKLRALFFGRNAALEEFYTIVSQVQKRESP